MACWDPKMGTVWIKNLDPDKLVSVESFVNMCVS